MQSSTKISSWIAAAMDGSGWTTDEIWQGIQSGDFHLFVHPEGCMVGEFIVSPRHKVMHIFAAGGSLKAMDDLGPLVEAFGRESGCDTVGATGRIGWQRYARRHGYTPATSAIEKEL